MKFSDLDFSRLTLAFLLFSLFVSDQVRCCHPISSFSKIRSSVGPIKENGGSVEDSVASTSSSSDVVIEF